MSRAFVKEVDGATIYDDLPDRPISDDPNFVTARGLALIEKEITKLRAALEDAQANDDTSATAEISRDLRYWMARRATADVVSPPAETDTVRFGLSVTIKRDDGKLQTYRIVGQDEADPAKGLLSFLSPLGRALTGKSVGEMVAAGPHEAEIVAIKSMSKAAR